MSPFELWPLVIEAWEALGAGYGPVMARAAKEAGFPEGAYFGWILPALGLDPNPISARQLAGWSPYTAPALDESRLAESAAIGFLRDAGDGCFYLTESGRTAAKRITSAAYAFMAAPRPLPDGDLTRLSQLLHRVVEACVAAPEPPGKWHLLLSRRTDPGADAPIVARIDQFLTDLNAYRNDASLAVWQPYRVSGAAWEAFTLLWQGEAATADDLYALRAYRGHPRETYAEAVRDLIARGWLAEDENGCYLTEEGGALRQQAEAAIDAYFAAPWACLDAEEQPELGRLLVRLRDGLVKR